jgi:hypothetical protein
MFIRRMPVMAVVAVVVGGSSGECVRDALLNSGGRGVRRKKCPSETDARRGQLNHGALASMPCSVSSKN